MMIASLGSMIRSNGSKQHDGTNAEHCDLVEKINPNENRPNSYICHCTHGNLHPIFANVILNEFNKER